MALNLLSKMKEKEIEPNVISYNATISACEKAGDSKTALALLSKMKESGIEPIMSLATVLLSQLVKKQVIVIRL